MNRIIYVIVFFLVVSAAINAQTSVYYTCPMHPEIHQAGPGKCPVCKMTLVKKEVKQKKPSVKPKTNAAEPKSKLPERKKVDHNGHSARDFTPVPSERVENIGTTKPESLHHPNVLPVSVIKAARPHLVRYDL